MDIGVYDAVGPDPRMGRDGRPLANQGKTGIDVVGKTGVGNAGVSLPDNALFPYGCLPPISNPRLALSVMWLSY